MEYNYEKQVYIGVHFCIQSYRHILFISWTGIGIIKDMNCRGKRQYCSGKYFSGASVDPIVFAIGRRIAKYSGLEDRDISFIIWVN